MNHFFLLNFVLIVLMFISCTNNKNTNTCKNSETFGTINIGESGSITSLFPISINNAISNQIVSLIHEGLVKYDAALLRIKPGLANRWEVEDDKTTYRFFLNTNAYFYDEKCFNKNKKRRVTAQDVIYSYTMLCSQIPENNSYSLLIDQIKGAKKFYNNKNVDGTIEGLIAENDSTLVIKLEKENPMFLHFLANPAASIIPKEAYEMYGTNLTTGIGPYKILQLPENNKPMVLIRNPYYFKYDNNGNCLPYIDTVKIYFIGSLKSQLDMLKSGMLDIVLNIDNETITSFLEENIKLFEGKNSTLKVILDQNQSRQHIIRSNIENFILNEQGIFDLTEVKFKKDNK